MVTQRLPLYPLGKDYVTAVSWTPNGAVHGVWGKDGRITCCGRSFRPEPGMFGAERIDCGGCLARLRAQGWEV